MSGIAGTNSTVTATTSGVFTDEIPNARHYNYLGLQVVAGAGTGSATEVVVTPQVRNDGHADWVDVTGDAQTVAASANAGVDLGSYPFGFIRFKCVADADTITASVSWCIKE